MKQKQHILILSYVILDYLATLLAWFCFFVYQKTTIQGQYEPFAWKLVFEDTKSAIYLFVIPLAWIILFFLWNTYNNILLKSRLKELLDTFKQILVGTIVLFFVIVSEYSITNSTEYLKLFAILFGVHYTFVCIFRMLYISIIKRQKRKGKFPIRTVLVGKSTLCAELHQRLQKEQHENNYQIIGYISIEIEDYINNINICNLGYYKNLDTIIKDNQIDNVIIAVENEERKIIDILFSLIVDCKVTLQILPTKEDHILRVVKNTAVLQESLIQLDLNDTPIGQKISKRFFDIICSLLIIISLSPIYLLLMILVKLSSDGSIFFLQERIGKKGVPFYIIKFRSMYENAEAYGPQLSTKNDSRITPFGRFLRKSHLDELPQFFNVLKGNMSIVGHRPERQYYIEKIIQKAPYYRLLLLEKPGITSWGQVRYGYAENVEQMIERLYFDILYLENKSLLLDIKIIIYTILNILKLGGK